MASRIYKGWNAKLLQNSTEIGYAESVTVDISTGAEAYFELGAATAKEIVAGNVEISGTIDRAWVDTKLLVLIGSPRGSLGEFSIKVSVADTTPNVLTVTGCKPEAVSFDIPQDGFLTHSFDFIAKDFSITGPAT